MSSLMTLLSMSIPIGMADTTTATATVSEASPTCNDATGHEATYNPTSNSTTLVATNISCSDANGNLDSTSYTFSLFYSGTNNTGTCSFSGDGYSGTFDCSANMNYYDPAQTYTFVFTVEDTADNLVAEDDATFDYNELSDFAIPDTVGFGTVTTGTTDQPSGAFVITNVGNVQLNMSIQGADLTNGGDSIGIGNITIDDDSTASEGVETGEDEKALTTGSQRYPDAQLTVQGTDSVWHFLDVPNVPALTYTGVWTWTGVKA